ncbi:diguanylate cyclase [bacterium AH-315-N03]|nr:diguanylate cyclase [bacterium AH-315-N03]
MPDDEDHPGLFDDLDDDEATGIVRLSDFKQVLKSPSQAFLMVLAGTNTGHMQKVIESVTVGRSVNADLRIVDDGASRFHARVFTEDGTTYVEDMGSKNGTRVNGEIVKKRIALRDGDKIQIGATCMLKFSFQDDLEEKFQRGMYEAALRDGLTKIFNKRALMEHLKAETAYSDRHKVPLSLIMFDLDHFKAVNDTHGHPAGDYVLRTVAEVVQSAVRQEDFLARYGGEEFAVSCRGVAVDQTMVLAERLRVGIEERRFEYESVLIPITISVGVAGCPAPGIDNANALIAAADVALYQAKNSGRNRVVRAGQGT